MKQLFGNLGLNTKEIQTFLKLLELGAQPASVIARHVSIPRPSVYVILESLKKASLVEEFERAKVKYFKCIPAKDIRDVIRVKEKKLQHTNELLQENLPDLQALENKLSITPNVRFLEGQEGIMKMYEQVLHEKGQEFCALFHPELAKNLVPDYYYGIPKFIEQGGKSAREIVVCCNEGKKYKKTYNSKNHQIKILPKNMVLSSDTIICTNRVYMISYGDKDVCATEIYNTSLAESQKAVFDYLWNTL